MFSKLGITSLLGGFAVAVMSMIAKFTNSDNIWSDITLAALSEDIAESIVTAIPIERAQNALEILFYDIHLGGVLVGLGILFFIAALFVQEH